MEEIIAAIAAKAGIEAPQARGALSVVLNFLHKEGPTETVAALADKLGLNTLLGDAPNGNGLMGAMGGLLGGSTGGALAAYSALQGLGLDLDQMKSVVKVIRSVARRELGDEKTAALIAAIPGLSQFV